MFRLNFTSGKISKKTTYWKLKSKAEVAFQTATKLKSNIESRVQRGGSAITLPPLPLPLCIIKTVGPPASGSAWLQLLIFQRALSTNTVPILEYSNLTRFHPPIAYIHHPSSAFLATMHQISKLSTTFDKTSIFWFKARKQIFLRDTIEKIGL